MTQTTAVAVIHHPPGLWTGAFAVAQVEGLRAILDLAGAKNTSFEYDDDVDTLRIAARWRL